MTLTFYGGLFWGILTGALTNLIFHSVFFISWPYYLYTLCNITVALVTALFVRWFPRELNIIKTEDKNKYSGRLSDNKLSNSLQLQSLIERAIVLILLSFAMCIVISVLGGIFSTLIDIIEAPVEGASASQPFEIVDPGKNFRPALARKGLPALLVEIGSRIPVNILDRLISSFAGFAFAWLLVKNRRKGQGVN
jgi:hypothetical protein